MSLSMSKTLLVKWALPIALVLALAASFTVVGSGSDEGAVGVASDDFGGFADDFGDFNPAYENAIVGPAEEEEEEGALPTMLYALDVENQTTAVTIGGGDLMTVTLTNLIEEPIANGTYTVDGVAVNVTEHGDIGGNIVITADIYAPSLYTGVLTDATLAGVLGGILTPNGAVLVQGVIASSIIGGASSAAAVDAAITQLQALPAVAFPGDLAALIAAEVTVAEFAELAKLAAAGAAAGAENWTMAQVALPIINYGDGVDGYLTCHPGKTVVVQVPIIPMCSVISILHYRAELVPDQNISVLL